MRKLFLPLFLTCLGLDDGAAVAEPGPALQETQNRSPLRLRKSRAVGKHQGANFPGTQGLRQLLGRCESGPRHRQIRLRRRSGIRGGKAFLPEDHHRRGIRIRGQAECQYSDHQQDRRPPK